MKNTGKPSEQEFEERLLLRYGKRCFIYRITDQAHSVGKAGKVSGIKEDARPSDFIVTIEGTTFYAEVKSTHEPRFAKDMLTIVQKATLKQQIVAGGRYDVYVHDMVGDKWYIVSGAEFLAEPDRKSWKWSEMQPWNL
jgi:hypothetical protein